MPPAASADALMLSASACPLRVSRSLATSGNSTLTVVWRPVTETPAAPPEALKVSASAVPLTVTLSADPSPAPRARLAGVGGGGGGGGAVQPPDRVGAGARQRVKVDRFDVIHVHRDRGDVAGEKD